MPARERKGYKGCVGAFSYGLKHFWGMIDLD